MSSLRIAVIGGGAAGFFGAITAAETYPDATVTIYEKSRQVLGKVRVSGGGRCNVTHACFDNRQFIKHYPRGERWLRPLLNQFDAQATVRWFESRGVALKTETDGRMFPTTDSSETIIHCLTRTADRLGVQIRTSCGIAALTPAEDGWTLQLQTGETLTADRVLVAVGGYPQSPSYGWLPPVSHPDVLVSPVPSLFTFNTPDNPLLALAGVSVPNALVSVQGTNQRQNGPLLITHWGFSGPAILRLSAWAARDLAGVDYRFTLRVQWLGDRTEAQIRDGFTLFRQQHPKKLVTSQNPFGLPGRLWDAFCAEASITETTRWSELPGKAQNRLIEKLTNSQFAVSGKSTFKDEFVTCGGIATGSLNPQTLESTTHPGLFFAGEVIDVDGITGGFNFQNAWTTGYIAGRHLGI
ncbi:aminoacetone oxidase family FAD-binding enzyme [Rudanella paleaurantiibacter]|uniref:Aminoacetone oxidase family FAD-binding enzyme n=1 Tax=Rudanella paleaurantiibacter TaxID=2614655 RepID=A0A7J5U537_9BACT|nr:NAD(P)/FAD-dependent oxidoreductase [Rudanella paleaurantiibacter]KAB7732707.1 aminoacetone oxidase family FAD-binding enzyme [Rudanella paleaurantiibacter]